MCIDEIIIGNNEKKLLKKATKECLLLLFLQLQWGSVEYKMIRGNCKIIFLETVLDRSTTFQVLLDFCGILTVESFQFFVETHISLINVIDIGIVVVAPTSTVLLTF